MERKRFLFILPFFPWPLVSGGHQALFNGIKAAGHFADIHLVYYAGQRDSSSRFHTELKQMLGGQVWIHPYVDKPARWTKDVAFRKIGNKIFKRADHFSYLLFTKLHDNAYYDFVNALIRKYRIDLVQAEMAETLDFVLTLPSDVRKVFVHHELRFVRNAQLLASSGETFYRRALYEEERIKEIALLNRFDLVLTVSEVDRQKLLAAGVTAPVRASFGVVTAFPQTGSDGNHAGSRRVTYVGPEAHYPNKLGLKWFLDTVWPIVRTRDAAFRMEIVGNWSKSTITEWTRHYPGIRFLGYVENLASVLHGSTMIAPVFVGSGIRMKILEAMSCGIPFVSTVVGAEGIPVQDGIQGFITDDAETFAEDLFKAEDPDLRSAMADRGRALVQEHYSLEALVRNRRGAYASLPGTE